MFERTHTEYAPWALVSGDNKRHARIQVLREVREHLLRLEPLKGWSVDVDSPDPLGPFTRAIPPAPSPVEGEGGG